MSEPKCYRCGNPISFDSKIKSKTGKYIPLDPITKTPHNCSELSIVSSSPKPKPTSRKTATFAFAAVMVIFILVVGIAASLSPVDNVQEKNTIEQSRITEGQNQVTKSQSSNSNNNIQTSNYNSGNAQYFTGKVTGIIDGDTINVDGKSIRFALASTPELNTAMGQAAKKYIQEICPMGSSVTVDEDDGQTQGSYGRIVAKVTCNGVNLNQAIIEKGFGHLSNTFCDQSEFSGDSWSGCQGYTQKTTSAKSQNSYSSSSSDCDPNYSGGCVPKSSRDLDCSDVGKNIKVTGDDPHGFDRDGDGIGCEG